MHCMTMCTLQSAFHHIVCRVHRQRHHQIQILHISVGLGRALIQRRPPPNHRNVRDLLSRNISWREAVADTTPFRVGMCVETRISALQYFGIHQLSKSVEFGLQQRIPGWQWANTSFELSTLLATRRGRIQKKSGECEPAV